MKPKVTIVLSRAETDALHQMAVLLQSVLGKYEADLLKRILKRSVRPRREALGRGLSLSAMRRRSSPWVRRPAGSSCLD